MKRATGIEWTDVTWNPMTGCTKISAGCDHCYAAAVARTRLDTIYRQRLPVRDTPANRADPFAPRFWPERLRLPSSWRSPRRVFVNSMSDVFHAHFTESQIRQLWDAMIAAPQHQFQVLTKRPERARRLADRLAWPAHIWLGVSVEHEETAQRIDVLRAIPAAVRFVSAEPLLGPLDAVDFSGVDWVIGGGESGPGARSVDPVWARGLRNAVKRADAAFFWKQWGGTHPKSGGRLLDGVEWSEYPVMALAGA